MGFALWTFAVLVGLYLPLSNGVLLNAFFCHRAVLLFSSMSGLAASLIDGSWFGILGP